jgi:hypothetical protein
MIYYCDKMVFGSKDNSYTLWLNISIFKVCNYVFFFFLSGDSLNISSFS